MNEKVTELMGMFRTQMFGNEMSGKDRINNMNSVNYDNAEVYDGFCKIFNNFELDNYCTSYKGDNTIILNDNVDRDLEMFYDNSMNTEDTIFNKIDHTSTVFGKIILKNILQNPTTDINLLNNRQHITETLTNNKQLYDTLLDNINKIKNHEKNILWFWKDLDEYIDYVYDMVYYNNPFLQFINRNESILQMFNMYNIVIAPSITVLSPFVYIIIPFIVCKVYKIPIKLTDIFTVIKTQMTNGIKLDWTNTKSICYFFMSIGTWLFFYMQGIYYSITMAINTNNVINILHNKINNMAECVKLITNTIPLIHNNFKNNFDTLFEINKCNSNTDIYTRINKNSTYLNTLLDNKLFNTKPTLIENKGKILSTYYIFKEQKNNILCLLKYIGIVDMHLSLSTLYKNTNTLTKNSTNYYSFVKYTTSNKPIINIKQMWHPYLNESIPNDITINDISNALITGPNAAGKSTFIKSLAINILFAQTIGLSSSKYFEMTPFYHINTYLHIPDCKGYDSLFQAEIHRCKTHIDKIKSLNNKQFSFVIMDEIFSSTNYNEGFSAAYSVCKKLSSFQNSISIITTHYTKLSHLENTTNKFKNYKFYVNYDKNNNIIFPFKIKYGFSTQYIALELLRKNGFDDDIINTAINICNKLNNNEPIFTHTNTTSIKPNTNKTKTKTKTKTKLIKNITKNILEDFTKIHNTLKPDIISNKLDIPVTKTDIISNKLDIPVTKTDIISNKLDIPVTKTDIISNKLKIPTNKLDIPVTKTDIISNKLDIPVTKTNIISNKLKIPTNN
jgi:DNA mismatch repair protein MutS